MKYFIPFSHVTSGDLCRTGRKAHTLAWLAGKGLPVPEGYCLPSDVYNNLCEKLPAFAEFMQLPPPAMKEKYESVQSLIGECELDPLLAEEIREIMGASPGKWMVRSSSGEEDGVPLFSYAGIFSSVSGLTTVESVLSAIRSVWASLWSEQALVYRRERGISRSPAPMAIILQREVDAIVSGVLFTRHPLTGDDEMVLNAHCGRGEELASGRNLPSTLSLKVNRSSRKAEGVTAVDASFPLDEETCAALIRYCCEMEELFGYPLDIEWVKGKELFIVQARPLSGRNRWTREPVRELFPEAVTPLSVDFLKKFVENRYLSLYRELGAVLPPGAPFVRDYGGRIYVNRDLDDLIKKQMTDREYAAVHFRKSMEMLSRLPEKTAEYGRRIQELLADAPGSSETSELWKEFNELLDVICSDDPVLYITYLLGFLLEYYQSILPPELTQFRDFFRSFSSTEESAEAYSFQEDLDSVLQLPDRDALMEAFLCEPGRGELPLPFQGLVKKYGHWTGAPFELAEKRLREDPGILYRLLLPFREEDARKSFAVAHESRRKKQQELKGTIDELCKKCASLLPRGRDLTGQVRWILYLIDERERQKKIALLATDRLREMALLLARSLVERGFMDAPGSLFFLRLEEIGLLVELDRFQEEWRAYVLSAEDEFREQQKQAYPGEFAGVVPKAVQEAPEPVEKGARKEGQALSCGVVTGIARVLSGSSEMGDFRKGEILVVQGSEPCWSVLFPIAAGFIAETGGLLSHAAILAREYDIPAISGVTHATSVITSGDRITLNADEGWVMIGTEA